MCNWDHWVDLPHDPHSDPHSNPHPALPRLLDRAQLPKRRDERTGRRQRRGAFGRNSAGRGGLTTLRGQKGGMHTCVWKHKKGKCVDM